MKNGFEVNKNKSKSSLLLLELIINILFFFILLPVCLKFYGNAGITAKKTSGLTFAVTQCDNIRNLYQGSKGDLGILQNEYRGAQMTEDGVELYFDKYGSSCDKDNRYYTVMVSNTAPSQMGDNQKLKSVKLVCVGKDDDIIYETEIYTYTPDVFSGIRRGDSEG